MRSGPSSAVGLVSAVPDAEPLTARHGGAGLSRRLRTTQGLIDAGLVTEEGRAEIDRVAGRYAVGITPEMADLIDRTDPNDPIAQQFVPQPQELSRDPAERDDPIGDSVHAPIPGIVHRYPDRVLLTPAHSCPVYCRFCFRRTRVGPEGEVMSAEELAAAYDYIRANPQIFEVIVTGGDPFQLSARRIRDIVRALSAIEHVGVIRFHTRVPVVDPGRIDDDLIEALTTDRGLFIAIHINHPREFKAPGTAAAIRRLSMAGVALLGQTVLLRGVNDDPAVLTELFKAMIRLRIKPYYLHHTDLAPGTRHFRPTIEQGRRVVSQLRGHISGLCQPTYVLDLPGGFGKVPIGSSYISAGPEDGEYRLLDHAGKEHVYRSELA